MSEVDRGLLHEAQEAMRHNDFERARAILARLVRREPGNEAAWMTLAKVVEERDQTIYCLRQVVRINPDNQRARQWLEALKRESLAPARAIEPEPQRSRAEAVVQEAAAWGRKPLDEAPDGGISLAWQEAELQKQVPRKRRNWALILGTILFLFIAFLAVAGPGLAPRDPMEENVIIQVNGKWEIPPFEIFTPGFLLGSDEFGRDLLSRLLVGIRPTMMMVLIVAGVRLLLGTVIGLTAGWANGRLARGLDTVIGGALSIPVLLVALGAIAIVGVELGIWAFIIGLSLTGWVETAQQVREQTRITKGQVYIEAAHALGASSRQILTNHVLKQITPMTVMLFAFELSSTLMATAGLGFLGYYIGGDVWVDVDDFVARRISGAPELGQMLATSWTTLTEPWAMVAVGTTIFLAVLSFNLLGEGLRQNLNLAVVRRRGLVTRVSERLSLWLDERVWYPLSGALEKPAVRGAVAGVLMAMVLLAAGRWAWPPIQAQLAGREARGTQIAAERPDGAAQPEGSGQGSTGGQGGGNASQITPAPGGEKLEAAIAWEFVDPAGFKGGPVLGPTQERVFIASAGGTLYALDLEGEIQWQAEIPAGGVGTPAVGAQGEMYVSDEGGGLAAVSAQGELLWHFQSEAGGRSVAGPVVAGDGTIYYTVTTGSKGFVQAVSPDGEGLWATQAETPSFFESPDLSARERYVFLKNDVFEARSGELLEFESDLNVLRYFSGQDGRNYLLAGQKVIEWQLVDGHVEVVDIAEWDSSGLSEVAAPREVGVTADRTAWLLYTSPGGSTSLRWVSMDDRLIGSTGYRVSRGQIIAMRDDLRTYVCGGRSFDEAYLECAALEPDGHEALWSLQLGDQGPIQGGFWLAGRLYAATRGGELLAIEARAQTIQAGEHEVQPEAPGLVWVYEFKAGTRPDSRLGLVRNHPSEGGADWRAYVFTEDERVLSIDAHGQLVYDASLPVGFLQPEPGRDEHFPPLILEEGTAIIVGQGNRVYALSPEGEVDWEVTLEADPYHWNLAPDEVYITDREAGLYVFDRQGLKWQFRSVAGARSASGAVKGPEGNLYYTVTPSSKGVVQAVSPQGVGLWATEVETGSFYREPVISPDGKMVFLKDEAIDAVSGEILAMEAPVRVDELIPGEDGKLYLRTGHTVMAWRYGESGFEVVNTITWNHSQFSGQPFAARVDEEGLVWMAYRGAQVWINPAGEVQAVVRYPTSSSTLQRVDLQAGLVSECGWQVGELLRCEAFKIGTRQEVWQVEIEGAPRIDYRNTIWTGEEMVVLGEDGVYKYYLGEVER